MGLFAMLLDSLFSGFRFHDIGGGKPSVTMRLEARVTRIQFARFANRCATGRARDWHHLCRSEIPAFHQSLWCDAGV